MEGLDYWRLCDELNIIQAALLIAGEDPSSDQAYIEDWEIEKRPSGYEAAKAALSRACMDGKVDGKYIPTPEFDMNGNHLGPIEGTIDLIQSSVVVADLKSWLMQRGIRPVFFFPEGEETPSFLDKDHPRYAQKLAAAVSAWLAIDSEHALAGKSPKQALLRWLRENSVEFGLTDDDGKLNELGIEECAKVANWKERGGAPRTPSSNHPTLDD